MKFRLLYTTFALLLGGFLLLNSSGGRAATQNEGNTGAPGDNNENNRTCQSCHNTGISIQVTVGLELFDEAGSIVTNYVPGDIYTAQVTVTPVAGNPNGYGFQMLSLIDAGQIPTNSWLNPGANVQIASTTAGREYAEHWQPSVSNEFEVQWEAPASGSGAVTFYFCGNGVNGNGESSGDNAACTSLKIQEAGPLASSEPATNSRALKISPNPASGQFRLELDPTISGDFQLQIFDQAGRSVQARKVEVLNGQVQQPLHTGGLLPGYYLIHLQGEAMSAGSRLVVLE